MQKQIPESISKILSDIFPKKEQWKIKLFQRWETIIGKLKDKVRIEKISSNLIVLGVIHPTWAQELHLLSDTLKQRINKVLGKEQIKRIQFKVVDLKKPFSTNKKTKKPTKTKVINPREKNLLSKEQQKILNKVNNKDLCLVLEQYYNRCIFKK